MKQPVDFTAADRARLAKALRREKADEEVFAEMISILESTQPLSVYEDDGVLTLATPAKTVQLRRDQFGGFVAWRVLRRD